LSASSSLKNAFLPNRSVDRTIALGLVAFWLAMAMLAWAASPFKTLPGPGEVWNALGGLWMQSGLSQELFTTLKLIAHALVLTVVISMAMSYATIVPLFRPLVEGISKLRFLGLGSGLVVPFTLITGGG
jgi:NitT/TauT family transport system permease protein